MIRLCFISFLLSVLLSFVLTRQVRNLAVRRGWVAAPCAHHIHNNPVPRLGGIAIFIAFIIVTSIILLWTAVHVTAIGIQIRPALYIMSAGTLIFLLGLYDDFRPLKAHVKFFVQAIAATILYIGGFRVLSMPLLLGDYNFGWIALPLTILWVLWITNAFNLIDGLDGLAAGSALFSTLAVFVVSLTNSNYLVSTLAVTLAGAIIGFLRFNFNPATIFLGDCGSLFIGFVLGALALVGSQKLSTLVAVAIPIVSFGLPILETTLSVLRRFLSGQPLFSADRDHIHHKLLQKGFSQRQAVILLYAVSAACGLLSLFLLYPGGTSIGLVLLVIGLGIWIGVQHLGYHEFLELGRVAQRTITQKQIIANNLAIRRAIEKLASVSDFSQLCSALEDAFRANDFDGFKLSLPAADQSAYKESNNQARAQNYTWQKPQVNSEKNGSLAVWTLSLELINTNKQKCGLFILYRAYNNRPLMMDINLLTSQFQVALADAVERVKGKTGSEHAIQLSARPHRP
jgi:UDP-GlcNAc:undecaprenyl-phosphate GlcNAc-1-phosphate transferase